MEREDRSHKKTPTNPPEPELVLQWGKRLRCVRFKNRNPNFSANSGVGIRRSATSHVVPRPSTSPFNSPNSRVSEERCCSTRGASEENGRLKIEGNGGVGVEKRKFEWPKLYITLSSKEKEEDFLAMKGCKLPQRPKKRAKFIQRSLLWVSPGAWLTDMCQERYEVREKKTSKKRPRGLKAMGAMDSDSE